MNDLVDDATPKVKMVRSQKKVRLQKKVPKGKFSLLLGGNLLVWMFFLVMLLDWQVFSISQLPVKLPQTLSVSGIIYSETSPHAIISKEAYGVGEVVEGWTIVNITRTEVRFEKGGKTIARQVR